MQSGYGIRVVPCCGVPLLAVPGASWQPMAGTRRAYSHRGPPNLVRTCIGCSKVVVFSLRLDLGNVSMSRLGWQTRREPFKWHSQHKPVKTAGCKERNAEPVCSFLKHASMVKWATSPSNCAWPLLDTCRCNRLTGSCLEPVIVNLDVL